MRTDALTSEDQMVKSVILFSQVSLVLLLLCVADRVDY